MLQTDGGHAFEITLKGLAAPIAGPDTHLRCPDHVADDPGHGETALLHQTGRRAGQDLGVDVNLGLRLTAREVDHQDLAAIAGLGRGKTNAFRGPQGLAEIIDQTAQAGVKRLHGVRG